jgi:hypothetical protein
LNGRVDGKAQNSVDLPVTRGHYETVGKAFGRNGNAGTKTLETFLPRTIQPSVKDSFYKELERVFDKFSEYHMKILFADFTAKIGRGDLFKPIGSESLHEISNDNGIRLVNFATSKNLGVKSTMFPHRNIHKYTWTFPDRKTHNQVDHILVDR